MDLRNTRSQLDEALRRHKGRPRRVTDMARQLYEMGERHGYDEAIVALCDATLAAAAQKMDESEQAQAVRDNPRAGDLEQEANYLLGVYQQLNAAYAVARASKAR